jgi:hypothetical protein
MSPTIVKLKAVLDDLGSIGGGATKMWFADQQILEAHSKGKILGVLKAERESNPNFSKHIPGQWECFDRAYWGISVVRCKCPGAPVGVAIGIGKEGSPSVVGQPHAIIYFWTWENNDWTASLYDPLIGEVHDFQTKAFVSFPPFRPNWGFGIGKILKPFDTLQSIDQGWIMLYDVMGGYNIDNFDNIKSDLANKSYSLCTPPNDEAEKAIFDKKRNREDRVFWVYNQLRNKYNRAAVGFALGTKPNETDKKKDSAAIVLWKSATQCIFWDVENGVEIAPKDFKPKFLLG